MFYIGLIESTSLYALIIYIIGLIFGKTNPNSISITIGCIYPVIVLIRQLIFKIKEKKKYSFIESYFITFFSDLAAPFRNTFMFFLIVTKKHIIKDINMFYNILDFIETLVGFICTIIIIILALITFL
jgi:hypothetical protein